MPLRTIENRQMLQILAMFLTVQLAGLLLATRAYSGITCEAIRASEAVSTGPGLLFYLLAIVALALLTKLITVLP